MKDLICFTLGFERVAAASNLVALLSVSAITVGCATTGNSLYQAAAAGNLDKVKALAEKGADVNKSGGALGSPLMIAANEGQTEVVRYLVEHGANVNAANPSTALYYAAREARDDVVGFLLASGADVNARDPSGNTPLHGAALGSTSAVSSLLKASADPNLANKAGWTPFNLAAKQTDTLHQTESTLLMLKAGATTNIVPKNPAVTGMTFGIYAAHLKSLGRTNEAAQLYLVAKGLLEEGVKKAQSRRKAASRKSFWAAAFEPMPQTPGSSYQQGAIQQNITHTIGTALFSHSSSEYADQKSSIAGEIAGLKECIAECDTGLAANGTDNEALRVFRQGRKQETQDAANGADNEVLRRLQQRREQEMRDAATPAPPSHQ